MSTRSAAPVGRVHLEARGDVLCGQWSLYGVLPRATNLDKVTCGLCLNAVARAGGAAFTKSGATTRSRMLASGWTELTDGNGTWAYRSPTGAKIIARAWGRLWQLVPDNGGQYEMFQTLGAAYARATR